MLLSQSFGSAQAAPAQAQTADTCYGVVVVVNPASHSGSRGLRHVAYDCAWKWVGDPETGHYVRFNADISASDSKFHGAENKLVVPGEKPTWTPAELLAMTPEEIEALGVSPEIVEQVFALYGDEETSSNSNGNGASAFAPGHLKKEEGEQNASTLTPAAQALAAGDGEVYTPPALADVIDDTSGNSGNSGDSSGNSSADESGCFTNNGGTHCPNGHAP